MPRKTTERKEKEPIEMNTDEALDYVFGTELADRLRKEAADNDCDDESETSDED